MKEVFGFGIILLWIAAVIGWILNIIEFVKALPMFDVLQIARAAGIIFAPLGSILGWFA